MKFPRAELQQLSIPHPHMQATRGSGNFEHPEPGPQVGEKWSLGIAFQAHS